MRDNGQGHYSRQARPMKRPCLGCGMLTDHTRCPDCTRQHDRHRGTRHERGYGNDWYRTSRAVRARDGGVCYWCGAPADTADHLVPKVRGGDDDESNLVAACRACNSARGGHEGGRSTTAR